MPFETRVADGVLQVRRPATRWLSTGWNGGFERAAAAYNVSVPEGWSRTDIDGYLERRRDRAAFDADGPGLLTGVEMQHASGARLDSVVAVATAGISNPAALPMDPDGDGSNSAGSPPDAAGTVNLVVGTTRTLADAALANLLSVVVEAKTATLLATTGFPGTTTDAVVVGSALEEVEVGERKAEAGERKAEAGERKAEENERAVFSGSATPVGAAARACVRDAVRASLRSRYADRPVPDSVADADHGVVTDRSAAVFTP